MVCGPRQTIQPAMQGLEGLEDLRVEAIAERLYQCGEAGDKLIHRADLRAVCDPGVLEHPPGYRHRTVMVRSFFTVNDSCKSPKV